MLGEHSNTVLFIYYYYYYFVRQLQLASDLETIWGLSTTRRDFCWRWTAMSVGCGIEFPSFGAGSTVPQSTKAQLSNCKLVDIDLGCPRDSTRERQDTESRLGVTRRQTTRRPHPTSRRTNLREAKSSPRRPRAISILSSGQLHHNGVSGYKGIFLRRA